MPLPIVNLCCRVAMVVVVPMMMIQVVTQRRRRQTKAAAQPQPHRRQHYWRVPNVYNWDYHHRTFVDKNVFVIIIPLTNVSTLLRRRQVVVRTQQRQVQSQQFSMVLPVSKVPIRP